MTHCTVEDCHRPTSDNLCPQHRQELVDALRRIAGDPLANSRETGRTVDARLRLSQDRGRAIAAARAVDEPDPQRREREQRRILRAALGRRVHDRAEAHGQGLWHDLQDAVAGRVRLGGGTPTSTPATEVRLPFNVRASDLAHALDNTITSWCRAVAEDRGARHLTCDASTTVEAAAWLAGLPSILATHPAAREMHAEITDLVREIAQDIDAPAELACLGPCGADLYYDGPDGPDYAGVCRGYVYARLGMAAGTCRACGTAWDAAPRRAWMLDQVDDWLMPASEIVRALAGLGERVTLSNIGTWADRDGVLAVYEPAADDRRHRRRFRLGDVLDLATRRREVA